MPANGVGAAAQPGAERDDEHAVVSGEQVGRAAEHGVAGGVDRPVAARRPDRVVEEQADVGRRSRQHVAVSRLRADEARVCRGDRREGERDDADREEPLSATSLRKDESSRSGPGRREALVAVERGRNVVSGFDDDLEPRDARRDRVALRPVDQLAANPFLVVGGVHTELFDAQGGAGLLERDVPTGSPPGRPRTPCPG